MELILEKLSLNEIHDKYYSDIDTDTFYDVAAIDPTVSPEAGIAGYFTKFLMHLYRKDPEGVKNGKSTDLPGKLKELRFLGESGLITLDLFSISSVRQIDSILEDKPFIILAQNPEGGHLLVRTLTKKANEYFGCNAGWCTTWDTPTHYERYDSSGMLFILIEDWDGKWTDASLRRTKSKTQCFISSDGNRVEIKDQDNSDGTSGQHFKEMLEDAGFYDDLSSYLEGMNIDAEEVFSHTGTVYARYYFNFKHSWGSGESTSPENLIDGYLEVTMYLYLEQEVDDEFEELESHEFYGYMAYLGSGGLPDILNLHDYEEMDIYPGFPVLALRTNGRLGGAMDDLARAASFDTDGEFLLTPLDMAKATGFNAFGAVMFIGETEEAVRRFATFLSDQLSPSWADWRVISYQDGGTAVTCLVNGYVRSSYPFSDTISTIISDEDHYVGSVLIHEWEHSRDLLSDSTVASFDFDELFEFFAEKVEERDMDEDDYNNLADIMGKSHYNFNEDEDDEDEDDEENPEES